MADLHFWIGNVTVTWERKRSVLLCQNVIQIQRAIGSRMDSLMCIALHCFIDLCSSFLNSFIGFIVQILHAAAFSLGCYIKIRRLHRAVELRSSTFKCCASWLRTQCIALHCIAVAIDLLDSTSTRTKRGSSCLCTLLECKTPNTKQQTKDPKTFPINDLNWKHRCDFKSFATRACTKKMMMMTVQDLDLRKEFAYKP